MRREDSKLRKMDSIGSLDRSYRVGVFAIPGFALMSYACTVEPLRAANLLSNRPLYEIVHFGDEARVPSSGPAQVDRNHAVGDIVDLDLLLVVAGGDPFALKDRSTFAWLRKFVRKGTRIGGVSGGPVVLANAGLLDGHRLTVHWEHAAALSEKFPNLLIERRLFVIDRNRVTCGGGTAPLDLMHALIASHHGGVFARLVSDWFLHTDIRAASSPQKSGVAERLGAHSPHVLEAIATMESHIGDPLSLSQLALVTDVSTRHLNRLFTDTFGQSVMEYYRDMRLETARRLLRSTGMSVGEVADAAGFANAGHFSNAYVTQFGIRPKTERKPHTLSDH